MNNEATHHEDASDEGRELEIGAIRTLNVSGAWNTLYLIPAEENGGTPRVELLSGIGPGTPAHAYHRRWLSLVSLPREVVPDSVVEAIESVRAEIVRISDAYEGSYWDGHNHRGRWSYGGLDQVDWDEKFVRPVEDAIRDAVRTYWDPEDYYATLEDVDAVFAHLLDDPNASSRIEDVIERELQAASVADVELSPDALDRYLRRLARGWLARHEDGADDDAEDASIRAAVSGW